MPSVQGGWQAPLVPGTYAVPLAPLVVRAAQVARTHGLLVHGQDFLTQRVQVGTLWLPHRRDEPGAPVLYYTYVAAEFIASLDDFSLSAMFGRLATELRMQSGAVLL